ncbi:MAG: acyl-CoA--6-aminopenicillanic acid acyl-transferase [Candidatus Magasanikbacteria bacterium]|nr:acyl-CoA--6-aminopenicillanic acid acyl-transferase [Candidatus Magasanikbacteria bacterium]
MPFLGFLAKKLPYVETDGENPYALGLAIGRASREQTARVVSKNKSFYPRYRKKSWNELVVAAKKLLPANIKWAPAYVEELGGLAEGAGVPFEIIWLMNVEEEIVDQGEIVGEYILPPSNKSPAAVSPERGHCSTILVKRPRGFLLGHNEDWWGHYSGALVMVKVKRQSGTNFLGLSLVGACPASLVGVNDQGVAYAGNSIDVGVKSGVCKNFLMRKIVDCETSQQIVEALSVKPRTLGNNAMCIVGSEQKMFSVESTPEETRVLNSGVRSYMLHTNFLLHPELSNAREDSRLGPHLRYAHMEYLLAKQNEKINEDDVRGILGSEHVFQRAKFWLDDQTVASVIVSVPENIMKVRNPSQGEKYVTYTL